MPEPDLNDEVLDNTVVVDGENDVPEDKEGDLEMAASDRAAESMEAVIVTQAQGHAFTMEQGRLNTLEGKTGYREALSHRIIGESGGGQSRAHLPAGQGGVPTSG